MLYNDVPIQIRVSSSLLKKFDEQADLMSLSRSELIRKLMEETVMKGSKIERLYEKLAFELERLVGVAQVIDELTHRLEDAAIKINGGYERNEFIQKGRL